MDFSETLYNNNQAYATYENALIKLYNKKLDSGRNLDSLPPWADTCLQISMSYILILI